jgi:hypothetical protein
MPGVRNEGLLATHELAHGARDLPIWQSAGARARPLLARREEDLLKALGFRIEPCDGATSILRAGPNGKRVALAVLLRPGESPDVEADRFSALSPVSYALTVADRESLPYVVVSQATKLRLYPVRLNVGVGRRGRTETFVEVHPGHLRAGDAAYLWLLFSAEALTDGGSLDVLLDESKRFAGELAFKLRTRIYDYVVPQRRLADATPAEVRHARKAVDEAREAVRAAAALCDIVTVCRLDDEKLPLKVEQWEALKAELPGSEAHEEAAKRLQHLNALHFPVSFPEVFLRDRAGFDVLLGNPPWEKARVEEHSFWAGQEPGLRSLPQREYERVRAQLRKTRPDLVELLEKNVAEAAGLRLAS